MQRKFTSIRESWDEYPLRESQDSTLSKSAGKKKLSKAKSINLGDKKSLELDPIQIMRELENLDKDNGVQNRNFAGIAATPHQTQMASVSEIAIVGFWDFETVIQDNEEITKQSLKCKNYFYVPYP